MRSRNGFTLVELLVVIGIIALLISVLLPALNKARAQANFTKCMSNQRQLLTALVMYCNENRGYFPGGKVTVVVGGSTKTFKANWDVIDMNNPFSLNRDETIGATWLVKYAKGSEQAPLMFCPADSNPNNAFVYRPAIAGQRFTSYRYSQTLFNTPEDIFSQSAGVGTTPQTPQKITQVRNPTKKAAIGDADNYHNRNRTDKINVLSQPPDPMQLPVYVDIALGCIDGHVEKVNTKEMFDTDINWTGRPNAKYGFVDANTAGVKGRDLK